MTTGMLEIASTLFARISAAVVVREPPFLERKGLMR
jgi:hypothetical protein